MAFSDRVLRTVVRRTVNGAQRRDRLQLLDDLLIVGVLRRGEFTGPIDGGPVDNGACKFDQSLFVTEHGSSSLPGEPARAVWRRGPHRSTVCPAWRRLPPNFARAQRERRSPRDPRHAGRRGPLRTAQPSLVRSPDREETFRQLECAPQVPQALAGVAIGGSRPGCDSSLLGEGTPGALLHAAAGMSPYALTSESGSPEQDPPCRRAHGPSEAAGRWTSAAAVQGSASAAD